VKSALAERVAASREGLRHPVVAVGIGVVLLQLVYRAWALYANWFFTDDYALLRDALDTPLDANYLLEPMNYHLMPGTRFLVWFVADSGPLNWELAASLTLGLQALTSLACLWMLVTVFGARWGVLAPLSLYLFSAFTAQATMWWVSSLNQTPVQLAFFLTTGAGVSYLRHRRTRSLAVCVLGLVIGLLFFQKALVVVPVIAFVALAYFASGGPLRRLLTIVRAYWPAVLTLGVVCAAYVAYLVTQVGQPMSTNTSSSSPVALADNMIGTAFLTAAFGGPWTWDPKPGGAWADPAPWIRGLCWVAAAVVIGYGYLTRKNTLRAWVLLAGYLTLLVMLVAQSRAQFFGEEIGLAYRLQTDAVCALVLCLGLAFMRVPGAVQSSEPRGEPLITVAVPPRLVVVAVVLVTVSGAISWARYADLWISANDSDAYVHALQRDLGRNPSLELVDSTLPESVMPGIFAPDNRVSSMTPLITDEVAFPTTSDRLAVVNSEGTVHQALIKLGVRSQEGPREGCGWQVTERGLDVPLEGRAIEMDWWLRIGYLADESGPIVVSVPGDRIEAEVQQGLNNLFVQLSGTFEDVRIDGLAPGSNLCVDRIEVGQPVAGPRL